MKKIAKRTLFLIYLFFPVLIYSQSHIPVVDNITYQQRTDGSFIVDIFYNVNDPDNDLMTVSVQASSDNGTNWNFSCANVTGDVGPNISNGSGKHIVWNFAEEHPNTYGTNFKIRILADDLKGGVQNIEWVTVPAGKFTYGEADAVRTIEYSYKIMQYEVTNAQYALYLINALASGDITIEAGKVRGYYPGDANTPAGYQDYYILGSGDSYVGQISYNGANFIIGPDESYNNHPVIYVTYYGAWEFADYYGYRLPSEEEWEKAARGNTGYDYPWGNLVDASRANYTGSGDTFDNGTTPVGYYNGTNQNGFQTTDSPSPYGCYDMAGNAWEWVNGWYDNTKRVLRGGSWYVTNTNLLSWQRNFNPPAVSFNTIGFRCVKSN